MKFKILFSLLIVVVTSVNAQRNPYEWDWKRDGVWTGVALATSATGLYLIVNKEDITENDLQTIVNKKDNINFLDRWAVGNSSESASKLSDIPFYLSFAAPLVLFFDDEVNDNGGLVFGMFLKSMATTGAAYGMSAGLINKSRPYVYNEDLNMNRRLSGNGQRSFFSGHTAATATATFFVAKVYQDFNPNSPGIPYVWAGAATLPLAVGALRIEAGQHFLTDVLIGYTIGAMSGILIPELHKKENQALSITPVNALDFRGDNYQGLSLQYAF